MDAEELLRRYQAGERDFRWSNLIRANLSGADLSGINLSGSDLTWANLRSAKLTAAVLETADLSMADLSGADLAGADLRGVYLRWTRLDNVVLTAANLQGAVVIEKKLERARSLHGAILPDGREYGTSLVPVPDL